MELAIALLLLTAFELSALFGGADSRLGIGGESRRAI
jgi:hypothetical protein